VDVGADFVQFNSGVRQRLRTDHGLLNVHLIPATAGDKIEDGDSTCRPRRRTS
jgi:hypothetical protein